MICSFSRFAALALALSAALPALAQTAPAPLQSELVTTGLYVIRGGGANTVVRFSSSGLVLVDAKAPGEFRPLMSQVHKLTKLSDAPVRALLLTSGGPAHAGNVVELESAGARVVADRGLVARLPAASASAVAPRVDFDREYAMRLGGAQVRVRHVDGMHPGGDNVVLFPDLRILAAGALFDPAAPPPATPADAALARTALAQVLALDFDRVVPATGPVVPRARLEERMAELDALASVNANANANATEARRTASR